MSGIFYDEVFVSPVAIEFAGDGILYGSPGTDPTSGVKVVDQPASRQLYLFEQTSKRLVADLWSGNDGIFTFRHLSTNHTFFIVGFDYTGTWRSESSDDLVPYLE